jgi:hypothetical protein
VAATAQVKGSAKPYSICGSLPLVGDMQAAGFDVQISGYGKSSVYVCVWGEGVGRGGEGGRRRRTGLTLMLKTVCMPTSYHGLNEYCLLSDMKDAMKIFSIVSGQLHPFPVTTCLLTRQFVVGRSSTRSTRAWHKQHLLRLALCATRSCGTLLLSVSCPRNCMRSWKLAQQQSLCFPRNYCVSPGDNFACAAPAALMRSLRAATSWPNAIMSDS